MNSKHQKIKNNSEVNTKEDLNLKDSKNESDLDEKQKKYNIFEEEISLDKTNENIEESEGNNKESEDENQKQDESINYEEEISKLREEKLRLLAEMENTRKRFVREKSESIKFGSTNLARDILSPNDNLTRALENIPDNKNFADPIKNLADGLKMVQKEFTTILEKHGIKKINVLNKKFDYNLHQAMLEIETNNKEEGVVVQEIQSGYTMHDRLLRPAMVGVSKKPKKNKEKK